MQLNIEKIKKEREARAWTQSQLAEITNLSIRTIQRIEKKGYASPESTQSICAAFGIRADEVIYDPRLELLPTQSFWSKHRITKNDLQLSALVAVIGFTISFCWNYFT